ncbi:MAG: glycosyltransferase [Acidimicrobiales bacterium]
MLTGATQGSADAIQVAGRRPRATVIVYRLNDRGGAERSTVLFLERLARSEFETRVLVLTGECAFRSRPELEALGMCFVEIHDRWPARARIVARDLWTHPPDLVHTTLFGSDLVGRLAAPLAGAPAMVSVVNMQYAPEAMAVAPSPRRLAVVRSVDRFLARHLTSAFHALTAAGARYAVAHLGADPTRVLVAGRGRELERFRAPVEAGERLRADLGIAPDAPVVVNLARQEPQKGQNLLLEAMAVLRERHPDVVLLVAGREGTATPELQEIHARLGLDGTVRLLGVRDDVPELLSACTVFVSSARYEGFGGAVLEAMASASPVVGFDIGPVREVLGGTGRLVPLGDVAGLAGALADVIEDPDLARAMGEASLAEATRRFSADAAAAKLVAIYRRVVSEPDAFPRPWITRAIARARRR